MSGIILGFFTVVLILICGFITLIVLMQRASTNAGMGASLGGGAAESALGGGASNVLVRGTIIGAALFFIVAFGLYLGFMANYDEQQVAKGAALPGMSEFETKAPLPDLTDVPASEEAAASTAGSGTSTVNVGEPTGIEAAPAPESAPASDAETPAAQ
ncbi:preprotein translocase subunit SecG [Ruficoccus sp. ZRK36]|uniref:preprotein translocase subunit SecG n=1 Tax=Ruficoccus sp. ZRK36 TaxID=2866311 RepID=UPI001C73CF60|nr:preprotein translocase subunit SecG [Ruficoccus sp. ZRK36]QYY34851.1 preprotein translocase subunit SecG [Ruficoccus sp. ZRK36]